ncbi:putative class i alpha-mannosidase protein [Botryosphaeria dothidea]|uniref:alpha-1,2-Mannosidase n=1 Tax=Botryosphaeria dothidea TaxID=55169 RepID=A0A8H4MZU5_9PEZI|nr:putative class i alpha-mannosidase protein [Botryosphaeria dothidea]KAF4304156.1 putative class i alpha-mannosidase protein [Botryosphaeria dothidea]
MPALAPALSVVFATACAVDVAAAVVTPVNDGVTVEEVETLDVSDVVGIAVALAVRVVERIVEDIAAAARTRNPGEDISTVSTRYSVRGEVAGLKRSTYLADLESWESGMLMFQVYDPSTDMSMSSRRTSAQFINTLWIMDLKDEFEEAVRAIDAIDFTTCSLGELNVFETTIRYLGGLLAAYDLSNGQYPTLLQKAWELGHMLYVAFDTPNRMPVLRWNFKDAAEGKAQEASENALSAEIGSLTLEFTRLAQITGDARFFDAAQRIMDIFEEQQNSTKLPGMWPIVVNAKTLDFTAWNLFTIGGMADSLYEYLPKQHVLLGGATEQYRNLFEGTARVMREHMFYRPMTSGEENILVPGDIIADDSGVHLDPKNQHLTCFAGGMFGFAGKMFDNPEDVDIGRRLTEGCLWAYETSPNGIMPEIMYTKPCEAESLCSWNEEQWFKEVQEKHSENGEAADARALVEQEHLGEGVTKVGDARYILRPEAIESIFILYRITGDETLRKRAWKMFQQIIRFTKTPIAHAGLDNCVVEDPPKSDRMESFWTAETLKYFYLLFSHPASVSLDDYVLNTEAHPLRRP